MRTDPTDVISEKIITKSESYGGLSYSVIKTYLNAYDPICRIENCFVCKCSKCNKMTFLFFLLCG